LAFNIINTILGGVTMYTKPKALISWIIVLVFIITAIMPAYAATNLPTGSTTSQSSSATVIQKSVNPYSQVIDNIALKKLTDKSIANNINKTSIKKLLSKRFLPYTGNTTAPKATFTGVICDYSDKVYEVDSNSLASLNDEDSSNDQSTVNNLVNSLNAKKQVFEPGSILIDKGAKKALKLDGVPNHPGSFYYSSPKLNEMFDEFTIPAQRVDLKEGNIISSAVPYQTVAPSAFMKKAMQDKNLKTIVTRTNDSTIPSILSSKSMLMASSQSQFDSLLMKEALNRNSMLTSQISENILNDDNTILQFSFDSGTQLTGTTRSGASIAVKIEGNMKVGGVALNADYSAFSGYKFAMTIAEEVNCKLKLTAKLDEEVYIPIVGLNVPLLEVGNVTAGVFLVAGINGDLSISIELNQGLAVEGGIAGPTFAYIPCGYTPYFGVNNFYVNFNAEFLGEVNGTLGLAPCLHVEVLGEELIGAEIRLGGGISCVSDGSYMTVEADGILYSFFVVLGKKIELLNQRWDIYSRERKDTGIYKFTIGERCAYRDYVTGNVKQGIDSVDGGLEPYIGPVTVLVKGSDNTTVKGSRNLTTDANGDFKVDFAKSECDIKKEDLVVIKIGDKESLSYVPTFPFDTNDIHYYIDFFDDTINATIDPVEVGKNEYGSSILSSYYGNAYFKFTVGPKAGTIIPLNIVNGKVNFTYDIKPQDAGRLYLTSDNFEAIGYQEYASCAIRIQSDLVRLSDVRWPSYDGVLGSSGQTATNINEYMFMYVSAQNMRGPRKVTNLKLTAGLERHEPSKKIYDIEMQSEVLGSTRGIRFYAYRFINTSPQAASGVTTALITPKTPITPITTIIPKLNTDLNVIDGSSIIASNNYRPTLEAYIRQYYKIPTFDKNIWRGMPADYEDKNTQPVYWDQWHRSFLSTVSFTHDGIIFEGINSTDFDYGQRGVMSACIPKPSEPVDSNISSSYFDADMTKGSLASFEQYTKERRDRELVTNPDDENKIDISALKSKLSNKNYIKGTISNEKNLPDWAASSIKDMVARGIIDLSDKSEFSIGKNITRGEFTAYVARTFGLVSSSKALTFTDVGSTHKYKQEIAAAYERGVINGVGNNKFAPDAQLTREQASTIIYKALLLALGQDAVHKAVATKMAFSDAAKISTYAQKPVQVMAGAGVINGFPDRTFQPQQNITVEQTAVILNRVIQRFIMK
jgi:hypothetical protein